MSTSQKVNPSGSKLVFLAMKCSFLLRESTMKFDP